MAISEKLLDKRVVERNLERGTLDPKAYEAFLEGLPDRENDAAPLVAKGSSAADEADESDFDDEDETDEDDDASGDDEA